MFAIVDGVFGSKQSAAVAAITIRNIEESLKEGLRQRAAANGRSMEDEVREILRTTLASPASRAVHPADSMLSRFSALGGVELELPSRSPLRRSPDFASAHPLPLMLRSTFF